MPEYCPHGSTWSLRCAACDDELREEAESLSNALADEQRTTRELRAENERLRQEKQMQTEGWIGAEKLAQERLEENERLRAALEAGRRRYGGYQYVEWAGGG